MLALHTGGANITTAPRTTSSLALIFVVEYSSGLSIPTLKHLIISPERKGRRPSLLLLWAHLHNYGPQENCTVRKIKTVRIFMMSLRGGLSVAATHPGCPPFKSPSTAVHVRGPPTPLRVHAALWRPSSSSRRSARTKGDLKKESPAAGPSAPV